MLPSLITRRLILRQFTEGDYVAVHSYAGCYENTKHTSWGPNEEADTKEFIKFAIDEAEKNPCRSYQFAVIHKESNKLIGDCNIYLTSDDTAQIGWILHRDFWKNGYGTEFGKALIQFGFSELKLRRITSDCSSENYGSYRIMENIGMRREGCFIQARPVNKLSPQKWCDTYYYAILRNEWDSQMESTV